MAHSGLPQIVVPPPGPKARAIIERDSKSVSPSYSRPYPLVMERGEGAIVIDPDGNRFLDFAAGIAVCSTGHCHPEIVAAIREQAGRFLHMSSPDFYYEALVELAEMVGRMAPVKGGAEGSRVVFTNSGTEAIEAAVKLARYATGRQGIVAFYGSFHGRTMGALSLTASKTTQRKGFGPLVPGSIHVPYADCYRCPFGKTPDSCDVECVDFIEEYPLKRTAPPEEVAAVLVEPIQGEGGYVVPPARFFQRLRDLCDRHGMLLIADEVQSGVGRTGRMFAMEHFGVQPDIIAAAKGIASGMPLGLCIASAGVMRWPAGAHASTFGGNPVSCAAALATLKLVSSLYMDNARAQGERLMAGLSRLAAKHALIGEIRGLGLMIGIELVKDRATRLRAVEETRRAVDECFKRGLLILPCGENTLRLCPPLIIDEGQAGAALAILDEALQVAGRATS
ncbi:MAG TPA: acetyl ornithine aminotransferase family protein [Candidatus Polarisedimenticolia bacterium]|nr:acetyl ornithine aminotransferase family protein [Candidatus Polarisedimenticolia bacterium]